MLFFVIAFWLCMSVIVSAGTYAQEKKGGQVDISGDTTDIDIQNKVVTFHGNVKVVQGSTTLFSDTLVMSVDDNGKDLKQAVATGNVRLVNEELTATGGEGTFYNQEQKIVLIDKAKVWQGNNTISAPRIVAYLGQEVLEGYSSGSDERAVMTIYSTGGQLSMPFGENGDSKGDSSSQDEKNAASEDEASDSVTDESPETGEEKKSPITIEADNLRLDNSAQQGRFSGDVAAVSGTTTLSADEMIVYITELPEGGNDVEKIEIFGNVKIINETQTVSGDKGFFWNLEQQARIEGAPGEKARIEDSAQNLVLEAPVVEIDLASNKVTAKKEREMEKEGAEEETPEGGSERIRMTFGTDETQSMFGNGTPEEAIDRYIVTEKTLGNLQEADVPDEILEDLALLQDREFRGEDAFMEGLEKRIGSDNANKYKKLLLKYSKVEENNNGEDLPSVTIQPDTLNTSQN